MSLSRVRSEIERTCAAWRLLNNICSGIFASVPRCAVTQLKRKIAHMSVNKVVETVYLEEGNGVQSEGTS
jgi:hypothetical protein